MAIRKESDDIYAKLEAAKAKRESALSELRIRLAEEKSIKAKADDEARNSKSADGFARAKATGRRAGDKIEYYELQISQLESSPLFDNYNEVISAIKSDQMKKIDQINERATKAMHDVFNMISAFYEDLEASNKALELAYKNTGFTYRPTTALPIGTIYKSANAVSFNPELSKYW